ncbi:MAG: helix-turn-helix domain-containing protein [Candidatus Omnitrophica bacterium]|nr:helix-turn-helix domain-containing protein [Candidatus Omnitrophota bacterium]
MGVVYKLTPEISSFIIEQKKSNPQLTCQHLAGLVLSRFGQPLSKSSVHELLKQSHTITPRLHKLKNKFQIPPQKKAQIFPTILAMPASPAGGPAPDPPPAPTIEPVAMQQVPLQKPPQPLTQGQVQQRMGEIFLKAAFWDLSFKPILGLKDFDDINGSTGSPLDKNSLRLEWESLTKPVEAIKVELEDSHCFYIDCRFQGLYADNPQKEFLAAPLERSAGEMPDYVLNNIQPLIIREFNTTDSITTVYDLIAAFENLPGKAITKISLIGAQNQILTEFSLPRRQAGLPVGLPLAYKRHFILGISSNCEEFQWVMKDQKPENPWLTPLKDKKGQPIALRILKKGGNIIITNLLSYSYDNIIKLYLNRHPQSLSFPNVSIGNLVVANTGSPTKTFGDDTLTNQSQWLKNRLKERALMLFPLDLPPAALEEILALPGFEASHEKMLQVHLNVPDQFPYIQSVQAAAACVNSLDITDPKGRKIDVQVDVTHVERF